MKALHDVTFVPIKAGGQPNGNYFWFI